MRWKKRNKENPKVGDIRIKELFAFLPILIDDEYVWFEKYISKQEYQENIDLKEYGICEWVEYKREKKNR